jgi:hypothetical protein
MQILSAITIKSRYNEAACKRVVIVIIMCQYIDPVEKNMNGISSKGIWIAQVMVIKYYDSVCDACQMCSMTFYLLIFNFLPLFFRRLE